MYIMGGCYRPPWELYIARVAVVVHGSCIKGSCCGPWKLYIATVAVVVRGSCMYQG